MIFFRCISGNRGRFTEIPPHHPLNLLKGITIFRFLFGWKYGTIIETGDKFNEKGCVVK